MVSNSLDFEQVKNKPARSSSFQRTALQICNPLDSKPVKKQLSARSNLLTDISSCANSTALSIKPNSTRASVRNKDLLSVYSTSSMENISVISASEYRIMN